MAASIPVVEAGWRVGSANSIWPAAVSVLVLVGAGSIALQGPDFNRFSAAAVVLVCAGSVALAAAAVILALESEQRPNAALFALAAVLFGMEWAFTWPHTPLPFVGLPLGQLFAVCLGVILLRYPRVRLQRPSERRFVCGAVVFTIIARGAWAVTTKPQWFAFGIASGHGHLPSSTWWLVLDANRSLSHAIAVATDVGQLLVVPVFLILIVRRVRHESPLLRAELLPVAIGTFALGAVLMSHLIAALVTSYTPAAAPSEWVSGALSAVVLLVPVAFIVAGVQRRLARTAIADLVVTLTHAPTSTSLQEALRAALHDDQLEVIYRLPDATAFVDVDGRQQTPEPDQTHPLVVPVVGHGDELLAVIRTGEDQRRHPSLVASAVAASALAIENTRLEAELRAKLQEVRESRDRVVAATLAERRRLERDLHDGVQQQLLAIGASVGRLALRDDAAADGPDELIAEIRDQLRATRHEVRLLARGLQPAVLNEAGLAAALEAAAGRLPLDITLAVEPGRWSPDIELTTYFVACEALTNCVVHAAAASVAVSVRVHDATLVLTVADDGRGGARFTAGGGLTGLRDRVRGLQGELRLARADGPGTMLEMRLPCE